ncbi:hypothetical protein TNIN_196841 [Trichonephila inaurata madagascariensis]|uniref:Uncharacterized protein n=1 Tax=Trichonephila inaurata madagascariensis TaxID=2747483 RepID=A0A8X6YWF8_9ARAC|nr:hypothetical protein TNIN_196841 [Trichonephila inaurata madagascariensis]
MTALTAPGRRAPNVAPSTSLFPGKGLRFFHIRFLQCSSPKRDGNGRDVQIEQRVRNPIPTKISRVEYKCTLTVSSRHLPTCGDNISKMLFGGCL